MTKGRAPMVPSLSVPRYPSERLAALSDGVFAFVLTLLVLELKVPNPPEPETELIGVLMDSAYEASVWLVSFVVISRMWLVHHDTFARFRRISLATLLVNFVFLGTISLVPFGANLVGAYDFEEPLTLQMFAGGLGLSGLSLGWLMWWARRDGGIKKRTLPLLQRLTHSLMILPLVAGVAVVVAFVSPEMSAVLILLESVLGIATVQSDDGDEPVAE